MEPMTMAALASAAANMIGQSGAAGAQAGQSMSQRHADKRAAAWQKSLEKSRRQAYRDVVKTGGQQMGEGEQQFLSETGAPLAELGAAKEAVLGGRAEGLQQAGGQMAAELQRGGVRGGQAATQMGRGLGQMGVDTQRMLDEMSLKEAEQRRSMRAGYMSGKAGRGQAASLMAPAF